MPIVNEKPRAEFSSSQLKPANLAYLIIKEDDFPHTVSSGGELYFYNGKHYEEFDKVNLGRMIYNFFLKHQIEEMWSTTKEREIKSAILYNPYIVQVEFDQDDRFINLNNGMLDLETYELTPHSKDIYFSYKINIDYDPDNLECPVFMNFLQGCFAKKGDYKIGYEYDAVMVENMLRLGGYLMYYKNTMNAIFVLIGSGANGKSMLLKVFEMFFDRKFVSRMSLNTLSDESGFNRSSILTSKINIATEQKSGSVDSEELKKISGGEGIEVCVKFRPKPINFIPKTKIIVACNTLPYFNDTTYAIIRRLKIFHFENKFVTPQQYAKEINPTKFRVFLGKNSDELLAGLEAEKPAIFNAMLAALKRLKEANWSFEDDMTQSEIMREYESGSDTLGTYLKDSYQISTNQLDHVLFDDIYRDFRDYYNTNMGDKLFKYSKIAVAKKFREVFRIQPSLTYVKDEYGKAKKFNCYYGVCRRLEEDEILKQLSSSNFLNKQDDDSSADDSKNDNEQNVDENGIPNFNV